MAIQGKKRKKSFKKTEYPVNCFSSIKEIAEFKKMEEAQVWIKQTEQENMFPGFAAELARWC